MNDDIWYDINFSNYYKFENEKLLIKLKNKRENTSICNPKNWYVSQSIRIKQLMSESSFKEREALAREKANYEITLGLLNLENNFLSSINFSCASSALQQLRSITRDGQLTEHVATLGKIAAELKLPYDKLNAAKSLSISARELKEYSKTASNHIEILREILKQNERSARLFIKVGKLETAINEFIFAGDCALQIITEGNFTEILQEKALYYYNRALEYKNLNPETRLLRSPEGLKHAIYDTYKIAEEKR